MRSYAFLAACLAATAPALAQTKEDAALTAPVQTLVDTINKGALTVPPGVFTPDCVVLDDFAPHRWSGATNCATWYSDFRGTDAKSQADFAAMKGKIAIGKPKFSRITADAAYAVFPGTFNFNESAAKRTHQTSFWIVTEKKVNGTWTISGHAWAITSETPTK